MIFRLFIFLALLLVGALAGWFAAGDRGAGLGLASGAVAWFVVETVRALRVLRWMRGDLRTLPRVGGLWAEAADRTRRLVVQRERELAEARRELEEFLSAIRSSPNGVVLLDPQGRIEWCNDTAAAQFGLDPQRDLLQHIGNLVREPAFAAYWQEHRFTDRIVMPAPGSTPARPVKLEVRLHAYGEGRLLLLSRDVTAVEQAELMRRDFVANVSHEIRTPLTVLAGFVETLQTLEVPQEERAHYLQLMQRQTQRMQSLVSDLLTLSRLEGSPMPSTNEWTPAALVLAQCEQDAGALIEVLGKTLTLHVEPAPQVEIAGAHGELLSALCNLVSNAVRYTPSGGEVHVAARVLVQGELEFVVRDTGPGIAAEHLPRLTERFYRIDRSRSRDTGGTGLGLAIVKHVLQRHGGEMRVESTPGAGSTFTLRLPANRIRQALAAAA